MAFQQGLSGLNTSSKALDVIGNNIANASTVGFKYSQAQFADVYASALAGGASTQVGIGGNINSVQQNYGQGNITVTNNPLDIAINGSGFFQLQMSATDATAYYTRNGQFHLNNEGYIVNANGGLLTGYLSPDGTIIDTAAIVPIQINTAGIPPAQTGWSSTVDPSMGGLQLGVQLDNRDERAATVAVGSDWDQLTAWSWDSTFSTNMYNYATSATIYDQSGGSHTLTNYYVRVDDGTGSRQWQVHTVLDNTYEITPAAPATTPTLVFNPNGTLDMTQPAAVTGSTTQDYRYTLDFTNAVPVDGSPAVDLTGAGFDWFDPAIPVTMDLGDSTQYGSPHDTTEIVQDGYGAGMLTRVTVDENGYVQGNYSNGEVKIMGQVVLAEFVNPNGLQSVGDNMWIETNASGQPLRGTPGSGTRGALQAGAVEESNVDLTAELVNMITMQRNYQANAQSIKTQDQIMQTLVNLR